MNNFKIERWMEFEKYLLVYISYDDGNDYVMIFKDTTIGDIQLSEFLSPNFKECPFNLMALLIPDKDGWELGRNVCKVLDGF